MSNYKSRGYGLQMKISFELSGWYPQMLQALKENRKMDSNYNDIAKVLVEIWLQENEESFKKEFTALQKLREVAER